MNRQFLKYAIGWGVILWLIGYILGILLFAVVPANMIGWIISPIGVIITLWVLIKKVRSDSFSFYLLLALTWVIIAVVFDYLLLVKVFNPIDGYYKFDVYLYYVLTFILPIIIGWYKTHNNSKLIQK